MASRDLSVYNHERFAAYLLALRWVFASFSAIGHELIILDLGCSSGHLDGIIRGIVPSALSIGFDLDLHSEVIEHMPKTDALRTLASIRKMLKTNGFLLLSTPNKISPTYLSETIAHLVIGRRYNGGDPTHINIYSQKEITELLHVSGLDVIANLGYWILPLTSYWITTASSKRNSSKWLQKLLMYTTKLTNPILLKAPSLGFVQILLCTNPKCGQS